ncbi:MAG: hypothetical protein NTW19_03400 [Planctomycetota bacterium]|nr:hypothetical protein [Planctomycetota bacterium]
MVHPQTQPDAHPAPGAAAQAPRRRRGMTLIELCAAAAALTAVMAGVVWASNALRVGQAERQTRQTLAILRQALVRYHNAHHSWPQGPASAVLATFVGDPKLKLILADVLIGADPAGRLFVRDGFGQAIHYVGPGTGASAQAQEESWQQPDFVSAGPDGLLGDVTANHSGRSDNIYGSDTETSGQ